MFHLDGSGDVRLFVASGGVSTRNEATPRETWNGSRRLPAIITEAVAAWRRGGAAAWLLRTAATREARVLVVAQATRTRPRPRIREYDLRSRTAGPTWCLFLTAQETGICEPGPPAYENPRATKDSAIRPDWQLRSLSERTTFVSLSKIWGLKPHARRPPPVRTRASVPEAPKRLAHDTPRGSRDRGAA